MNRKKKTLQPILWKYKLKKPLTQKESDVMYKWVSDSALHQQLFDELSNDDFWDNEVEAFRSKGGDPAWNIIGQRLDDIAWFEDRPKSSFKKYMAVAAAILLLVTGAYLYFNAGSAEKATKKPAIVSTVAIDREVAPAVGKAVLRLGDGSIVRLDEINRKMLGMERYGMFISIENGSLIYRTHMSTKTEEHTLIIPRAAQYKVILPDGSEVWLNAESTLRFPTAFNGSERLVELTGEGYFDIAKNKSKPFMVKVISPAGPSKDFEIRVLGTHFNVNAYNDEGDATTTLVEGSVIVTSGSKSVQLTPGDEAIVGGEGGMKVAKADISETLAWKDKLFIFQDQTIPEIMRQIERWYDIKVIYKGNIKEKFTGILPRDLTLGQILTVLDKGGKYSFEVKDKTVIVFP